MCAKLMETDQRRGCRTNTCSDILPIFRYRVANTGLMLSVRLKRREWIREMFDHSFSKCLLNFCCALGLVLVRNQAAQSTDYSTTYI